MKRILSFLRRRRLLLAVTAAVLLAVALLAGRCLPSSGPEMRASVVTVRQQAWYALYAHGRPVLFFAGIDTDSCVRQPAADSLGAAVTRHTDGCWINRWPAVPSCRGRIVTVADTLPAPAWKADDVLLAMIRTLQRTLKDEQAMDSEMAYYLRVHGVKDEGYQQIAALATRLKERLASHRATLALADSLLRTATPLTLRPQLHFTALYTTEGQNGKAVKNQAQCRLLALAPRHRLALLQTADRSTPDGVKTQYLLPWNTVNRRLLAAGHAALGTMETATTNAPAITNAAPTGTTAAAAASTPVLITGGRRNGHTLVLPRVLATDGTPLFTPRGLFAGVLAGHEVAGRNEVSHLLMKGGWQ